MAGNWGAGKRTRFQTISAAICLLSDIVSGCWRFSSLTSSILSPVSLSWVSTAFTAFTSVVNPHARPELLRSGMAVLLGSKLERSTAGTDKYAAAASLKASN
ncbi:hypothetical protein BJX63DRAFT_414336 [Aspergillus granulosus]|uniref:Secreted protein n=1 Tax=Aspergillus granulosus TaxID=176169 RepID=A0ABR4GUC5_9EURO